MKPKILFRADGNHQIGLGHLYRVLSLMQMLQQDFDVALITRATSDYTKIFDGYTVFAIPPLSTQNEIDFIESVFSDEQHIYCFDGYEFDDSYQKQVKSWGNKIICIDDFGKEFKYADLIINHSPVYFPKASKKYALGTQYSILRPLFLQIAQQEPNLSIHNKNVLVCFGGSDFHNLTQRTVELLLQIPEVEEINVILGSSYGKDFSIKDPKVKTLSQLDEQEMLNAFLHNDRIIVPSSTILYEAVSVRKYILSGFYVDNQKMIYQGFKDGNAIIGVENFLTLSNEDYLQHLKQLINYNDTELLKNQKKMIDGKSKQRIIQRIKSL